MKCIKWISLIQAKAQASNEEDRHHTSFAVTDRDSIAVVGGLSHYFEFEPKTHADADILIEWLKDWKERH